MGHAASPARVEGGRLTRHAAGTRLVCLKEVSDGSAHWRHIRRPPLWIFASAIGWLALYLVIGKSIDRTLHMIALGAVPAMVTGLALLWLGPSRVISEADRSHRA